MDGGGHLNVCVNIHQPLHPPQGHIFDDYFWTNFGKKLSHICCRFEHVSVPGESEELQQPEDDGRGGGQKCVRPYASFISSRNPEL